ncbi:MAG TPA: hypothetical protein VI434_11625 [Candidatus Dormibacteraeota bacterium]
MRRFAGLLAVTAMCTVVATASCGTAGAPASTGTNSPQSTPPQIPTLSSTPPPSTTAAPTASELLRVARLIYPACTPSTCAGSFMFTTCDAASAEESDVFADCPLTPTLEIQLRDDVGASPSAPDPLGGGQDPEWTAEEFAAQPSATGGVVEVSLGVGAAAEKLDLVMIVQGSQLLVNDLYCTASGPDGGDAIAPGWLERSTCPS